MSNQNSFKLLRSWKIKKKENTRKLFQIRRDYRDQWLDAMKYSGLDPIIATKKIIIEKPEKSK